MTTTARYPGPLLGPDLDHQAELRRAHATPEALVRHLVPELVAGVTYETDSNRRVLTVQVRLRPGAEEVWKLERPMVLAHLTWWAPEGWTVELR